jgi:hypothetical protein
MRRQNDTLGRLIKETDERNPPERLTPMSGIPIADPGSMSTMISIILLDRVRSANVCHRLRGASG